MPVSRKLQRMNRRDRAEAPEGPNRKRGCSGCDVSLRIFYATWRDAPAHPWLDACAGAGDSGCAGTSGSRDPHFLCGWSSEAFAIADAVLYTWPRYISSGLEDST